MKLKLNQNEWIKMGRLYRRVPVVKHIHPLLIPMVIFIGLNFYLIRADKKQICTCDQWIRDDKLRSLGNTGNKIVQFYLNHVDSASITGGLKSRSNA